MATLGWKKHNWRVGGTQTSVYARDVESSAEGELVVRNIGMGDRPRFVVARAVDVEDEDPTE